MKHKGGILWIVLLLIGLILVGIWLEPVPVCLF